jgi:ribonuclease HI
LDNKAANLMLPVINYGEVEIVRENTLKYLGITFDRSLSFKHHVDNIIQKANGGLSALKVMAGLGMPQHTLATMMLALVHSRMDYGLGLLSLSSTQITRIERIQNEAMRLVLGCPRDTPVEAMKYILNLPSIKTRHKCAQVREYLRVSCVEDHLLQNSLSEKKGARIKRGKSWMACAEESITGVCNPDQIPTGADWLDSCANSLTQVHIQLGRQCREWAAGKTEWEINELICRHSDPEDYIVYTDGSVIRDKRSGWGFVVYKKGVRITSMAGAYAESTSSMRMEIEAATMAIAWLVERQATGATIITDSQSMLRKIEGMSLRREWVQQLENSCLKTINWIYCPGHAGVRGNEIADRLALRAPVAGKLALDKEDIAHAVLNKLQECESVKFINSEIHQRLIDQHLEKGCGRKSKLCGQHRAIRNQSSIGTISLPTLRKILKTREEHLWVCPEC